MKSKILFLLTLFFVSSVYISAGPKGHLFIIGGGTRTPELMNRFIELAGGKEKARIIVLPMASSIPDTVGREQAQSFNTLGVKNAEYIIFTREQAMSDDAVTKMNGVTGVFFSGGDQSHLTAALAGTPLLTKLKELYDEGAVIGGTSAGAAVMSKMMITGRELLSRDSVNAYAFIKKNNIETVEGFGFLQNVIVDQHFIRRKRHNRLISLVLENPQLTGIGIDEATAIIVKPDEIFEVTGDGTVMLFDASNADAIRTNRKGHLSAHGILMHILMSGDSYNMKTHAVQTGR